MKDKNLNFLFSAAATAKAGEVLFADEDEEYSGAQAMQTVQTLACAFSNLNVNAPDRIAFLCDSSVRHTLSFFACQHAGIIPCALHVRSTADNIARALEWLDARILIIESKYLELANEVLSSCNLDIPIVVLDAKDTVTQLSYDKLLDSTEEQLSEIPLDEDAPAMIILSSGTTGKPKGIVHSQRTLYESAMAGQGVFGEINKDDSVIVAMSPSFAAWNHVTLPDLAFPARIIFSRGFDAKRYVASIDEKSITHAALVPTAWRRVLAEIQSPSQLQSLRKLFFSGEPGTADFINSIKALLPQVEIRSAYLSSEGGDASAAVADHKSLLHNSGSIGLAVAGAKIRFIDIEGSLDDELKQGDIGEIAISSPSLALGYWKDESLTKERFVDGWWRSGDLGYVDQEGALSIAGRNDNLIISGGLKVHAEEIEAALMQHPAVTLAAVVGVPDPEWGQRIEAHVVTSIDIETDKIIEFCLDKKLLVKFKLPKKIHFHDSLPIGATGKIFRRGLLEATTD